MVLLGTDEVRSDGRNNLEIRSGGGSMEYQIAMEGTPEVGLQVDPAGVLRTRESHHLLQGYVRLANYVSLYMIL